MSSLVLGDWGTSRLRLWRVGVVPAERRDGPGIGSLDGTAEAALAEALGPWLDEGQPTRVVLCGMAGSRGGLREAAYADCPVSLDAWRAATVTSTFQGIPLRIAAGVALPPTVPQPDVMRGEETQVFGAMALHPELSRGRHVFVLPGTHSKWVWCEDGAITAFRTAFSGELFALLQRSTLLAGQVEPDGTLDPAGFAAGLAQAQIGDGLLLSLFPARAAQLRQDKNREWARGYLSGLVIGSEIRDIAQQGIAPAGVTVVGDPRICALYVEALRAAGIASHLLDGDACVLAGLELLDA